MTESNIDAGLRRRIDDAARVLQEVERDYSPAALATSFGAEDMVLTDLVRRHAPGIAIFTLDTGRLNEETHRLHQQVRERYGIEIETWYPDAGAIERFVRENGINAFYRSVDLRKACCGIRKVEPLRRALAGRRAWVTGLRRAQSVTRSDVPVQEHDAAHGLEKFNPLVDWSEQEVWAYIHAFGVPYNELHDRGYPSIGCAPCTRAVTAGEDIRAGRWWWEDPASKECGLHVRRTG
ncbi:MAG TPA: phosphoadenylyl-sulfate reductase [Gammaproteobacteria bacterium]|nr:phosphoadenylyl-sulfate reductase [Gammaproteobacteria bacterium]